MFFNFKMILNVLGTRYQVLNSMKVMMQTRMWHSWIQLGLAKLCVHTYESYMTTL